ncbi:MAG: peptidoglycan-associated lipoprotein Pal [Leptothrix sp. (in: b-proteobacteria)]
MAPIAAPTPAAKPVASTVPAPQAAPKVAAAPAPAPPAAAQPVMAAPVAAKALPAHLDPTSDIATKRSVYFDFDTALIKPEFRPLVELHANYLIANPALAIKIEGNTDERGSHEYNLALGQKRAEAVRQALKLIGVPVAQMEAVSLGEESPKATGHTESAWSQNRRADIQYPSH